jgi:hypothetical protein
MEAYGGPAQPSPTIAQCLNGDTAGSKSSATAVGHARASRSTHSKIAFRQCPRRLGLQAMRRKWNHWGYYVMAIRESVYPPSWRWRIIRRGKPMGVRIEGAGFRRDLRAVGP